MRTVEWRKEEKEMEERNGRKGMEGRKKDGNKRHDKGAEELINMEIRKKEAGKEERERERVKAAERREERHITKRRVNIE